MNVISHNCVGGRIYQQLNRENGNPFVWVMITPDDFWYLYNNYDNIDFTSVSVLNYNPCVELIIDGRVKVLFPHYNYDKNCDTPTKKTNIDIFYNKISDYVLEKYRVRLERMHGAPLFIVSDREFPKRPQYNFNKEDLEKYVGKPNCVVAVFDRSIRGNNVIYMPFKNMDPKDIADVILRSDLVNEKKMSL